MFTLKRFMMAAIDAIVPVLRLLSAFLRNALSIGERAKSSGGVAESRRASASELDLELSPELEHQAQELTQARMSLHMREIAERTDRLFSALMIAQSIGAVLLALLITPRTWVGASDSLHIHVWVTLGVGISLSALVTMLTTTDCGRASNAYVIAIAQSLMGCLLIHLTGGRIETHFYIFGSLAFLAHYRLTSILVLTTSLTAIDHLVRGMYWPQSAFGLTTIESWRWLEHTAWLVFEDIVLIVAIRQKKNEMHQHARKWALLTINKQVVDDEVARKTEELEIGRRRLQASQSRLRQVIDTAHDAYICLDAQLRVKEWSHRAEQLLGWEESQVIGKSCCETIQAEELCLAIETAVDHASLQVLCVQPATLVETVATRSDCERLAIEASWSLAQYESGVEVNLFVRDITGRRAATAQQVHSQKMESIGQLAAGIAHEINTPSQFVGDNLAFLNKAFQQIDSLIQLATQSCNAEGHANSAVLQQLHERVTAPSFQRIAAEIPKALVQSEDGMQRISSITSAMKEFSHPGSRAMSFADLHAVISSAVAVCRNEWKYVADITLDFAANMPNVACLPGELGQVIVNLVVNAAHAIGEVAPQFPSGRGRITISTRMCGEMVQVDIADNGPGIPEAIHSRVFDPFFTTKPVGKGTGQGLAIAHAVMDKHHGTIRLSSSQGHGATFTLRWPWNQGSAAENGADNVFQDAHPVC